LVSSYAAPLAVKKGWHWWANAVHTSKTIIAKDSRWFLIGVAIRLALMPFATQSDLIVEAWLSRPIAFLGWWNPYSFSPTYIPQFPPPILYLQAAILRIAAILLPDLPTFLNGMDLNAIYLYTANYPHIHELLLILKLPYLAFDILTAILLALTVRGTGSKYAFRFWMLNPIAIYASFIFSQFDIIPTFFTMLAVYYCYRKKPTSAALSLGLGGAFKIFPLLLLPLLVLGLGRTITERLKLFVAGVVPFLLVMLPFITTKGFIHNVIFSEQTSRVGAAAIPLGVNDAFSIYIAVYAIIALHCMFSGKAKPETIWKWFLAALLSFYALAYFHPQWFIWFVPLAALAYAYDRRTLSYFIILCLCFVVFTFHLQDLAGPLFASISPSFFMNLPSPQQIIGKVADPALIIQLFRSVLTGTALWWAYRTLIEPGLVARVTEGRRSNQDKELGGKGSAVHAKRTTRIPLREPY
jgi:hypothetical protein